MGMGEKVDFKPLERKEYTDDDLKNMGFTENSIKELSNGRGEEGSQAAQAVLTNLSRATYSDSPLVNYTYISPNCNSPRNHTIDTITIHMVWGQCSVEALGNIFAPVSRQASSNYGVGYDGRIGLYCHERDRSWCSSSGANDHRAITIETASDTYYPYAVTDKAYNALINLCADICRRNGKKKMVWCGSLAATNARTFATDEMRMTLHKWFAATECPGYYLESRMQDIANKVNAKLGVKEGWIKENGKWYYYQNGKKYVGWLKDNGKWYYLDAAGAMQTGWIIKGKKKYYCGKDGAMLTGWQTINGDRYYFKPGDSGQMQTGWITLSGKTYYLGADGAMRKGWQTIKNKKYYFNNGVMQIGWFQGGSKKWYYFNKKGVYSRKVSEKFTPYWVITTDELNVRKSYSSKSQRITTLPLGTKVAVVYSKQGKDGYTWGLLTTHYFEKDGWIALKYTQKI